MSPQTKVYLATLAQMRRAEHATRGAGCCRGDCQQGRESPERESPHARAADRALIWLLAIVLLGGLFFALILMFGGEQSPSIHSRLSASPRLSATAQTTPFVSSLTKRPSLAAGRIQSGRLHGAGVFSGEV